MRNFVYELLWCWWIKDYDIDNEQASYWLTILQEISWPKITMTIRKEDDLVKVSLRSKDTNVEKIAKNFWWGWHIHASWFTQTIKKNFNITKKEIIKKVQTLL